MSYKVKFNNKDVYDLKDGFVIKKEYNENLDSGTIVFTSYNGSIDVESFDSVEIYDSDNKISKKHFLVDSGDEETFSFGDGLNNADKFNTILLFSQTKELERITLPSCSVTQPISGTKKTVWEEFVRFCNLYLRKIKIYDDSNRYRYVNEYAIDDNIRLKFRFIDCPELQWNEPTLREVLNDLLSVENCIVIVKNNVISYYDLTEKGNEIDTSLLNYSKKSFSSADYCSDLTINMKNAIGRNKTIVCEKKGLRSTEGELTTENAVFITQHPIYNIISCKISYYHVGSFDISGNANSARYYREVDITDYIVEKDIYDLKDSGRVQYPSTVISNHTEKDYQAFLLKYTRGDNQIELWGANNKYDALYAYNASHLAFIIWALGKGTPASAGASFSDDSLEVRSIAVDLVYETVTEHNLHAGRYLKTRHFENRLFDNQSNSYVDANHQSMFEYFKVNRLGNKIREIKGTYFNESDIPQLGDTIGDEILFDSEVEYLDNQFNFVGHLTKNYILKNYFTGVQSKKRSWQLAKGNDALTRQDILKYFIEASFTQKKENDNDKLIKFPFVKFVDSMSNHSAGYALKYAFLRTYSYDVSSLSYISYPDSTHMYQVDLNAEIQGMSMVFEFGTMDNVIVDYYIEVEDSTYLNKLYKYCNEIGEFDMFHFILSSSCDPTDGEFTWPSDGDAGGTAVATEVVEKVRIKPLCLTGEWGLDLPDPYMNRQLQAYFRKAKDNREIIRQTVQVEYCSDTDDIVITQRFLELCSACNDSSFSKSTLRVFVSTDEEYQITDTLPKGTEQSRFSVSTSFQNGFYFALRVELSRSSGQHMNCKSWGITDSQGKLMLGVNTKSTSNNIWLNLLLTRDDNIYYNQTDRTIVGDISNTQAKLDDSYDELTPSSLSFGVTRRRRLASNSIIDITETEPTQSELISDE